MSENKKGPISPAEAQAILSARAAEQLAHELGVPEIVGQQNEEAFTRALEAAKKLRAELSARESENESLKSLAYVRCDNKDPDVWTVVFPDGTRQDVCRPAALAKLRAENEELKAELNARESENASLIANVQRESGWVNGLQGQVAKLRAENEELKRQLEARDDAKGCPETSPTRRPVNVGDIVWFCPPQEERTDATLDFYPALVVRVDRTALVVDEVATETQPKLKFTNPRDAEQFIVGQAVQFRETTVCDLVSFGPSSMYHNNAVPFAETPRAGTWTFRE